MIILEEQEFIEKYRIESDNMCTGIKVDYDQGCVMGRTMDYEVQLNYNAIYYPRDFKYGKDLMDKELYSKYKVLGMCFEARTPLKDGVNEHGLIGITNEFAGFNLYDNQVKPGKKNISSLNYLSYALTNYKSVDELVEDLPNIHMATKDHMGYNAISPDFHYMFVDSTKRSIVIEPKRKELYYYENPYDVMTNSPGFESYVKKLNKFLDLDKLDEFNSSKDLPGGYDPISRFIKAFYLNKMNIKANTSKEAFSNFYNIMGAMTMPNGFVINKQYNQPTYTRYTCAYDTKDKILTVKSHTNPKVYELSFDDIEDKDKKQEFYLDLEFKTDKLIK